MRTGRITLSLLSVIAFLFLTACQMAQWRVLQEKIDPKLVEKPKGQIEAERQGAQYISVKSSIPEQDTIKQLQEIHAVAVPLSSSLGAPEVPMTVEDAQKTIKSLEGALTSQQRQADAWRDFARKNAGVKLEGTGYNLAGPAGLAALAGVIALCVLVPPIGYVFLRMLPVLWGFFRKATNAVSEFADKRPDAANDLAVTLRGNLNSSHKRLINKKAITVIRSDA